MQQRVNSQLAAIRRSRGINAADLARRVGVSRQTIYAIEAGTYVPNTEVSLRLSRELEVAVEDLFVLVEDPAKSPESISSELLAAMPAPKGQPVRICSIAGRWVGVPVTASPYFLPEADGIVIKSTRHGTRADIAVFSKEEASQKRLVVAGCDPAMGMLARMVEKFSGIEILAAPSSSRLALTWLKQGNVHIAGSHLEDAETGEFNLPFLRAEFPHDDFTVVTFARWEEGFVTAQGNPKSIRKAEDLAGKNVRFINREAGSGSRALLDRLLTEAGLPTKKVTGYDRIAFGHLAAAYAVFSGEADCCLATRSAAQTFALNFVPMHSERYDLVLHKNTLDTPAAQAFLDVLQRASLRRKLELLAGYDTTETGNVLTI